MISLIKKFIFHICILILITCLCVLGIFYYLDYYTLNKQTITVPNLEKIPLSEAIGSITSKKLNYVVLDSVYIEGVNENIVLRQHPHAKQEVKENRVIYLNISKSIPPTIKIPSVIDLSKRLAIAKIKSYNIFTKLKYEVSICKDCIIRQEYMGKEMTKGQFIKKGDTITLVVGVGLDGSEVILPNLLGLTKEQAINQIKSTFLSEGISDCIDCKTSEDSLAAFVYKQIPEFTKEKKVLKIGSTIDFWMTKDSAAHIDLFAIPIDSNHTLTDSTNSSSYSSVNP